MSTQRLVDIEEAEKIERLSARQGPGIIRATPFVWREPHEIPPRQWLYGAHYIRRYVTATVAAGGLGKSSNALVENLAMASGRSLVGVGAKRPLRVWYWNGEDPREETERRVAAICKHFQIAEGDIGDRLYIDNGRDTKILIAEKFSDKVTVNAALVDALAKEIIARNIDCLTVDPFVSSHSVPENDNGAIDQVARAYADIAEKANCSIELIHHTRKLPAASNGERTIDDARGAGALGAAARSVRILNAMNKEEAEGADVKPEHRLLYFRIDNGKRNMQPPAERADWRKLISVPLGNSTEDDPEDWVQVTTHWTMPTAFDGITTAHLDRVIEKTRSGSYRESPQSPDWIGHAVAEVIDVDLEKNADRKRVNALIRSWLRTKALKVVEGKDKARRRVKFVVPGPGPEGGTESVLKSQNLT